MSRRKRAKRSSFTFSNVPTIRRPRTSFPLHYSTKTTANIGVLVPYDIQEVYSGDTWSVQDRFVSRTSSPYLRPVLDSAFVDQHHFFVPLRTLYDKYTNLITGSSGDGEPNDWSEEFEGSMPMIPAGTVIPANTVGDALGLPVNIPLGRDVSVLPFRAVAKIYNEWYRDENTIRSTYINFGEYSAESETPNNRPWSVDNYMGQLPFVGKFKDYFTSALPKPQKGDPVEISPITLNGNLPVASTAEKHSESTMGLTFDAFNTAGTNITSSLGALTPAMLGYTRNYELNNSLRAIFTDNAVESSSNGGNGIASGDIRPVNLWALTDGLNLGATNVNDLRLAFALQKIKERSARGGNRYTEYILSAFGVQAPDASLQRSEFLGGMRTPLGYTQVAQTSSSTDNSPLAEVGAFGLSMGQNGFKKAFTENGYIISFLSIRYRHTYQQGIAPLWTREERFDFYDPTFQNIGEQPIYATELLGSADSERVFGYKGAWDELRVIPSKVTKQMRSPQVSGSPVSQDIYHFADIYSEVPVLSEEFINENPSFMGRTLAVDPNEQDPFIFDIYRHGSKVSVMPVYSVPSLIDHH